MPYPRPTDPADKAQLRQFLLGSVCETPTAYIPRDLEYAYDVPKHQRGSMLHVNTWSGYEKKAKALGKIDFGCAFDENGLCARGRQRIEHAKKYGYGKPHPSYEQTEKMACCSGCAISFGYLEGQPIQRSNLDTYVRLFDPKTGYWRPGTGCSLPRELRSPICLRHQCHVAHEDNLRKKVKQPEWVQKLGIS